MKHVPLSRLEAHIVRPGLEDHLKPLLRFKGNQTLGRVHRLWNLMVSAMLHEASDSDITMRLVHSENYSQLCGPENRIAHSSLRSFCGRLVACPQVLALEPHLAEYIDDLLPSYKGPLWITPLAEPPDGFEARVSRRSIAWAAREYDVERGIAERWFRELGLISTGLQKRRPDGFAAAARGQSLHWAINRYDIGYAVANRWFSEVGLVPIRTRTIAPPALTYPFLIHDGGKPEHSLLRKVSAAVPQGLPPSLRADMCQDLIVSILAGDMMESELDMPSAELARRIWKSAPAHYAERSIDEVIAGDDFTLMDTLADEGRDWA